MSSTLTVKTRVLANRRIEIETPDLVPGESVEVTVIPESADQPKRSIADVLSETQGHRQFKSAQDVRDYLKEERDAWE